MSEKIVGIHFMYGLEDHLNLNSIRLLLIPCCKSDFCSQCTPILTKNGYLEHFGNRYFVNEVSELLTNFVKYQVQFNDDLEYKKKQ
jgi:hypothetical protein